MFFSQDLLKGRAALVTGGGTGICRGIALALAAHGCDVAIASRDPGHLEPTAREIEQAGASALAVAADVRDAAAVENAVGRTADRFGRLDIVINGAAGNFLCLAEHLSPNGFGTVVDIDLKGTFNVAKAALPHLKARGGVIVNVSATLHYLGTVAQLHVSAAKAGIDALTRNLAVEWGPYGIRVNGLAPGPIEGTEGVRRLVDGPTRDRIVRQTPLGRFGRIEDVAAASVFLCSDAAAFINGVTLVIDGGLWLNSSRMIAMEDLSRGSGRAKS
jgi:peroxisomal 2,4-dienoyl-CoA reductase